MTTTENNKLIAKFMGKTPYHNNTPRLAYNEGLLYHTSWDWLMPVVEKIESLDYLFNIVSNICTVTYAKHPTTSGRNKIDATYKAVVEFIKWYNDNKE